MNKSMTKSPKVLGLTNAVLRYMAFQALLTGSYKRKQRESRLREVEVRK